MWHARSERSMAEDPSCQATTTPAEPSGKGCATREGDREKQGMSEAKEKTCNPIHGMPPSSVKRAWSRHRASGDCLDPISQTFSLSEPCINAPVSFLVSIDSTLLSVESMEKFPLTLMVPAQAINSSSSLATCADLCLNLLRFVIIILESKSFCTIFLFTVISKNPVSPYYLWLLSTHSHLTISDYEHHHSQYLSHSTWCKAIAHDTFLCPFASPHKDMIRNNAAVDSDCHIQQNRNSILPAHFLQ